MLADLPPNSRKTFFTVPAAWAMMRRPVPVEPVNETTSTRGSEVSISPTAAGSEDVRTLSTPAGRHSAATLPMKVAVHGVSGADFSTTLQPAASAGQIFAMLIWNGKFHGEMAATTPAASFHSRRLLGTPMVLTTGSSLSQA